MRFPIVPEKPNAAHKKVQAEEVEPQAQLEGRIEQGERRREYRERMEKKKWRRSLLKYKRWLRRRNNNK